jgi:hypothetical protein
MYLETKTAGTFLVAITYLFPVTSSYRCCSNEGLKPKSA